MSWIEFRNGFLKQGGWAGAYPKISCSAVSYLTPSKIYNIKKGVNMTTQFKDELTNLKIMLKQAQVKAEEAITKGDHEPCLDAINTILLTNEVDYIISILERNI
jgi:hypothetical protein